MPRLSGIRPSNTDVLVCSWATGTWYNLQTFYALFIEIQGPNAQHQATIFTACFQQQAGSRFLPGSRLPTHFSFTRTAVSSDFDARRDEYPCLHFRLRHHIRQLPAQGPISILPGGPFPGWGENLPFQLQCQLSFKVQPYSQPAPPVFIAGDVHLKARARRCLPKVNHSSLQVRLEARGHNERQGPDREFFISAGLE